MFLVGLKQDSKGFERGEIKNRFNEISLKRLTSSP